jgi:plastocyanin
MRAALVLIALGLILIDTGCSDSVQDVRIAVQDYRFQPAAIRVQAARPVRLTIVNEGREAHEFSMPIFAHASARILEWDTPIPSADRGPFKIFPGRTAVVTMKVPAGVFWYRCIIQGHRGMDGTLIAE